MSNNPNYEDVERNARERQKEKRDKELYEQTALNGYINELSKREELLNRDIKFNTIVNFALLFAASYLLLESAGSVLETNFVLAGLVSSMGAIFLPMMAIVWNYFWLRSFRSASYQVQAVQDSILSMEKRLFDDSVFYERWVSINRATDHGFKVSGMYRYLVLFFITCFATIVLSAIFAVSIFST
ncbi:hypothetical protein [Parasphingorhabdus sp.]|uniref:hypothetical protein n=1 Tax=Parasphingorhabdus sp. TaxID=2709688 RepID=UPI003BAF6B4E